MLEAGRYRLHDDQRGDPQNHADDARRPEDRGELHHQQQQPDKGRDRGRQHDHEAADAREQQGQADDDDGDAHVERESGAPRHALAPDDPETDDALVAGDEAAADPPQHEQTERHGSAVGQVPQRLGDPFRQQRHRREVQ